MEQTLNLEVPSQKIYKDRAVWVGTFLGGPLVAGYLIAENFKAFDEPDKAKKTWWFALLATVVIFGGIFLIPDTVKIPNHIIPLVYTGIASLLVQKFQGPQIAAHLDAGGAVHGWWRTIGAGLVGLAVTLVSVLAVVFVSDAAAASQETSRTYGQRQHEIAYDSGNMEEAEVDRLAAALTQTTFFDEEVTKYVYAEKQGNTYVLSISCNESVKGNAEAQEPFVQLRRDMEALFSEDRKSVV